MSSSEDDDGNKLIKDDHHINEYDGYITDDEQEEKFFESSNSELNNTSNISSADDSSSNLLAKKKKKRKSNRRSSSYKNLSKHTRKHGRNRNIPIIAFMGPNSTGKSTLLNLIVGEPVFVTMDELSDYDTLSKVVRLKIVTRADREFILLDVEGLFPDNDFEQDSNNINISDAVLKIFFAVYSIASVIVWNDTLCYII